MAFERWNPSPKVTRQEQYLLKRCEKKRRLFLFLRQHRHEIFDDAYQDELEEAYRQTGAGKSPKPVALMAMALILQGYHKVSDSDAVELSVVDLRWQMVLGRLGSTSPAFSQGALFDFRERLIGCDMDRRLLERTAQIARASGAFDARKLPKTLRIAVDASPLEGAGKVEDTLNLIGHAARKIVVCAAKLLERDFEEVCRKAGIPILLEKSVKKALDRDWSDSKQKGEAIEVLARQVLSLERWLERHLEDEIANPPLSSLLATLHEIIEQDLEPDPNGGGVRIAQQVAPDRRISIEDGDMRHGRKSKTKRIDGFKRHVATDLDSQAVLACAITPANRPEHEALESIKDDVEAQGCRFGESHFDRGYMGSPVVGDLARDGTEIVCKPWTTATGKLFTKDDFKFDLRANTVTCPAGHTVSFTLGKSVQFDPVACLACPLRSNCTTAMPGRGRTLHIANDEPMQEKLRRKMKTPRGRARFRERGPVEHRLAHIGYRQGRRARYRGIRKNLFDVRRAAAIQNLETAQRNHA